MGKTNWWFLSFLIIMIISGFIGFINPMIMSIAGLITIAYGILLFGFWVIKEDSFRQFLLSQVKPLKSKHCLASFISNSIVVYN